MSLTADYLRDKVIRPTLHYLGCWSDLNEGALFEAATNAPELGLFAPRGDGLGVFHITASQHRDIWDRYLAFNPEVASRIRGLASQRAFLSNPEQELQTNLGYAAAIAWLLYLRAHGEPQAESVEQPARA